jgi:Concanavalin A-like lectin/glucanases superfamily/CotH kinase protein/Chitobiase/beta-hexosaminidase C-terminal domain/Lamin Tail Domain/PA14 domain
MRSPLFIVLCVFVVTTLSSWGQAPRAWLKFDGDLVDSSGAALITAVTPNVGYVPTFTTDRFGVANQAIVFNAAQSLRLVASSLVDNSNQALGLRNAAGTNTSFTLMAWVYVNGVGAGQGYNTVFGNLGAGLGTLHVGVNNNSDRTHFGFDGNDANGGACALVANQWYHLAFVYDTTASNGQRMYVNGIPDATRINVTNTIKAADLYLGNWGTDVNASNDFKGRLDDVVIYNTALKGDQILALYNGTLPNAVPAVNSYNAPATNYGYRGTTGMWGVREIKTYPGIAYNSLVNCDRILKAYAATPGGTVQSYWTNVLNITDDEGPGLLGNFPNEGDFATNTAGADDNVLLFARCTVKVPTTGSYTFGFRGDDGSRLRVVGKNFSSSTRLNTGNSADPAHIGDTLYYPNGGGDSHTIGVVSLTAGEVDLEYTYWEGGGGCALEVFAAPGSKSALDATFQLLGNVAAGGLEIIRDSDTVPTFTVNGGAMLFKHAAVPATMTLAWAVNEPTTTLSIDQGIGAVANTGSLVLSTPGATRTYTITATTGIDVVTRTVTVYVDSPPVIQSLAASDTTVVPGAAVTLTWAVAGATSMVLNPGNITVTGTSRVVNPVATTTYTLTATNVAGSTPQSIVITTGASPVITSFSASDLSPMYGKETSLTWAVTGSDSQAINQNVGAVAATGSIFVVPYLTATYTLTATNVYGSTVQNVALNIPTPIGVNATGFTARRVSSTVPLPFAGQGYLASALSLLAGQNAGAVTTTPNYTTINFTDGADGDFTAGNVPFPGGSGDNFAVEITGTFVVNVPGTYDIIVNCDDGCRLRIDGVDVIVDDSTHSPTASSGRYTFTKPTAQVQLVYYDVVGGASCEMAWIRPNLSWQQIGTATATAPVVRGSVIISEFVGSGSTLTDEDGATQDWIEIWNSTTAPVDLAGHYLSTSAATPAQWAFPSKVLAPNAYLVVYASLKNRINPMANLHTNFTVPGSGGYLALKKADGVGGYMTLTEFNPFPNQTSGESYGSSDSEGYVGFMETPTPGGLNAATFVGFIAPVSFSVPRGRYTTAFNLVLSSTPGAEIRYTLDGSEPSINRGLVYTAALNISATTTLRAAAFMAGWKPWQTETNTYLFLDDIVNQTSAGTIARGWPAFPVNGQVYRYGMALANVTAGGGDLTALKSALSAAPSVCINMNPDDFHGPSVGIHSNPGRRGRFWERDSSFEIIEPDGITSTQIDCGIRIRGNASRSTGNPKHAFHLYFRGLYGDGDLVYPLFGNEGAVTRFDQIDMRCEQNNSWSSSGSSANAFLREEFARKTQGDMGQPYSRNSYFHLYINGIYWGIFNWQEKTEADYGANQFGGTDSDFDTPKSAGGSGGYLTELTDGNDIAWKLLFNLCLSLKNATTEPARTQLYLQARGLNPDGTRNPAYPVLLDVDNLIDYQITTFYCGSHDAPMSTFLTNASNNWFGLRDRVRGDRGFVFFAHDFEWGMINNVSYNRVGPWGDPNATGNNWGQTWTTTQYRTRETFNRFNPHYVHEFLCFSEEYRQRFQDRAHKHLLAPGGALTQASAVARSDALSAKVDPIVHAESARWGSTGLTKTTWLNVGKAGVYSFINSGGTASATETTWSARPRNLLILEQLKGYTDSGAKPLAAVILAPVFSGQLGGDVTGPYTFTISNGNASGTIYYTVDGQDPRAISGGLHTSALTGGTVTLTVATTVRSRIYLSDTNEWSPLTEASYFVSASPASMSSIVVSKLHYNPSATVMNAEYIELLNISSGVVNLNSCSFTVGVSFSFPPNYLLNPGQRCVIVQSTANFATAFPGYTGLIAGQFGGSLDNSGERILLVSTATGSAVSIQDFIYDDAAPWPLPPDGSGPALVLMRPETNPAHGVAAHWRSTGTNGGAPGEVESYGYAPWNLATSAGDPAGPLDGDGDGIANLMEYALGLSPITSNGTGLLHGSVSIAGTPYMTIACTRPVGRDDVIFDMESSLDLTTWTPAVLISRSPNYSTGTETCVYRHPNAMTANNQQFMRAKATRLP